MAPRLQFPDPTMCDTIRRALRAEPHATRTQLLATLTSSGVQITEKMLRRYCTELGLQLERFEYAAAAAKRQLRAECEAAVAERGRSPLFKTGLPDKEAFARGAGQIRRTK